MLGNGGEVGILLTKCKKMRKKFGDWGIICKFAMIFRLILAELSREFNAKILYINLLKLIAY